MSDANAETQTQTATEPTPASATPVAEKPEAKATETQTQSQTDKTTSSAPDPKEVARKMFRDRDEKREKRASEMLAEANKKLAEYESRLSEKAPQEKPAAPSLLDDSEGWAKQVREDAKREALGAIEEREAVARFGQSAEKAEDWLLTRKHLKEDPALIAEVAAVLEAKYVHLASFKGGRDPQAAAELAYLRVCEQKGIQPDMGAFKSSGGMDASRGATSSGVRPSAPAGAKRTFQPGEVKQYLNAVKAGSKEWKQRMSEVDEAYKEGRAKR
jgi:hypothetical protein